MSDREPVIRAEADWPVRPLGELVTVLRRGTAPVYVDDSGVKAIGQRCVTDADFDGSRSRPHSAKAMSNVVVPQAGDVLVNSTGTGTIGRSVTFREDGARYIVDGHVTVARPREKDLIGRWLNDVLRSPQGQRYLEARCYAGSTNQIELSSLALAAMPVAVPSVDEQRRVAEVLDTLDDQIRLIKSTTSKLRATLVGLLSQLMTRGVRSGLAPLGDVVLEFGEPSIRLPERWTVEPIERLLGSADPAMRSGPFGSALLKHELVESGVPLLGIDNVQVDRFVFDFQRFVTPAKAAELSRYRVRPADVMITIMGTVGRSCLVPEDIGFALSSKHVWTLTLDENRYRPYLASLQLNHAPWARAHLRRDEQGGIMSAIRSDTLKTLMLPTPPIDEQLEIEAILKTVESKISSQEKALKKLRAMKIGLTDDLLTGRVRAPAKAAS
ncbi:restriction endonuclease subunit S [Actinophytocola sp.]|uniref:restriction endonuclease subunit S n=1 Tax=Actinophytocola sp. TaxID=1872138 RepID=UPI003D6B173B